MPIPKPKAGQSKDDYLSECIAFVLDEGTAEDEKQAYAICNDIWEEERKVQRTKGRCVAPGGGAMSETRERRVYPVRELVAEEGKISGYAAVFGEWSEDLGGFRERIRRGAFANTLTADVRALWQHDPSYVLGRTTNGTLRLQEDEVGLRIEVDPPETNWAQDAMTTMRRGDVDQMSFGFETVEDEWTRGKDGEQMRELVEVNLFDVSPVTFPAYPQTSVQVREHVADLQARAAHDEEGADEEASSRAREDLKLRIRVREVDG
jgi:HK97 family phage prohead protease